MAGVVDLGEWEGLLVNIYVSCVRKNLKFSMDS